MKGKICENGRLELSGRRDRKQTCPYTNFGESWAYCGDWCPQFGEPCNSFAGGTRLEICHGRVLYFEEGNFVDERAKEETEK